MGMPQTVENGISPLHLVEQLAQRYDDVPVEAIVKEDLLRRGMAWSPESLEAAARYKPKAYVIFSFDMVPISAMDQDESRKAPEEARLSAGPWRFSILGMVTTYWRTGRSRKTSSSMCSAKRRARFWWHEGQKHLRRQL